MVDGTKIEVVKRAINEIVPSAEPAKTGE